MSKGFFLLLLIILTVIYFVVKNKFQNEKEQTKKTVNYIFIGLYVFLFIIGVMFTKTTKQQFSNVSAGFDKARNQAKNRPNPMFDINTYWDSLF